MDVRAWLELTLAHLSRAGETGRTTVAYLTTRKTRIRFLKLPAATGACWLPDRNIYLNSQYFSTGTPASAPRLLSLIVHETRHLQQGFQTALSVYGELEAWQLDFNFQRTLIGRDPDASITELCALPLVRERAVLKRAAELMQAYAGKGYRIDLYPIFPIFKEIGWRLGLPSKP